MLTLSIVEGVKKWAFYIRMLKFAQVPLKKVKNVAHLLSFGPANCTSESLPKGNSR